MFAFKKHKQRTITPIKLWDTLCSSLLQKDDSTKGLLKHKPFYIDLTGMYSGADKVTYMYTIDSYPAELDIEYRKLLRRECRSGVRISFIDLFEPHKIPWKSHAMTSKLKTWETLDNETDEVTAYNYHDNLSLMDNQERRRASLTYLSQAEIRRRRKTFKVRGCMLISGDRGDNFNETVKEVLSLLEDMDIKVSRVTLNVQDFLSTFSPFALDYNDKAEKDLGSIVVTDEILSRFNTYSQGTIGVKGMYWGTDINSAFPCLKVTKRTTETAENWLVTAETGGGKSYFCKGLLIQLLGDEKYRGTIMDIEGFEYLPLAEFTGNHDSVVVLNMAEGTGAYFDPVEIVLTGNKKLDADMFNLSKSYTLAIYKTLLGNLLQTNEWVDIIIEDAVATVYKEAGVIDTDMSTWSNSKGLVLKDVYVTLKELKAKNDDHKLAKDLAIAKLSRYFEDNGSRVSQFRQRVSIEQIAYAKLVVCSFGMAGKTEKSVDPIQMALMQLCASIVSHLRSVFSKNDGLFNFKLWEEFQRWGKFPDSEKTIGTALTGGRKLGDINIIVTNVVKELLDDDRFGIFSNITSLAVGCIWDSDVRTRLCRRLSIPQMLPELNKLVTENLSIADFSEGDNHLDNPYSKGFLIGLDKTVYALARMSLPASVEKSSLFRTGVDEKVDKEA